MGKVSKNSKGNSKKNKQFEIVVSADRNLVAYNCDELGEILFDNEGVGKLRLSYFIHDNQFYEQSIEYALRKAGFTEKADQLREILRKNHDEWGDIDDVGFLNACFCLSSTLQYPIRTKTFITDISEIPPIWEKHGLKFDDAPDSFFTVCEEDFMYWLAHRDPGLAAKVKALQARNASPYEIAYTMFPNLSYDLKTGDRNFPIRTPKDIGRNINEWVNYYINKTHQTPNSDFSDLNLEKGGIVEVYLKTHPVYSGYISTINSYLRARKPWDSGKYAPYNGFVALYQLSKALGHSPFYAFPDGRKVFDLKDLKEIPADQIAKAIESGNLSAWIATFFQEDPKKALNDEVSYAKEVLKFTEFINSIYPSYKPSHRYKKALREIDEKAAEYRKVSGISFASILLKCIFVPLTILMFLLAIGLTFEFHIPDYNVIANHYLGFSLVIGIAASIFILFVTAGEPNFLGALIMGGIIGFVGTWLLKLLMGYISPYLTWIYLALILAVFIFFMTKLWHVYEKVPGYAYLIDVGHPDFKLREMSALNYAYGPLPTSERGDNDIDSYLKTFKYGKRIAQKSQFKYAFGGIFTAFILIIGLFLLSPDFGGEKSLFYKSVSTEAADKTVTEPTDSVKPKPAKKASRKSKSKTKAKKAAATEINSEVNTTETESPVENTEEVKKEETKKVEEVSLEDLPQFLNERTKKNN